MLAVDQLSALHKQPLPLFSQLGRQGLIFVEGTEWKNSKKILSKVFNFNFVLDQVSEVVNMCD